MPALEQNNLCGGGNTVQRRKVFGIGLSRTGTTSLTRALEWLGYRSVHWPHDPTTQAELLHHYENPDSPLSLTVVENSDCVTDTPIASVYRELDRQYPGSYFILTTRDHDSWLGACERFWSIVLEKDYKEGSPSYAHYVRSVSNQVYGRSDFDRDDFRRAYDVHLEKAISWFQRTPRQLLLLGICSGDGWNKLCEFLDLPIPAHLFPHANKLWLTQSPKTKPTEM
jgi:Sulfotransferase domain